MAPNNTRLRVDSRKNVLILSEYCAIRACQHNQQNKNDFSSLDYKDCSVTSRPLSRLALPCGRVSRFLASPYPAGADTSDYKDRSGLQFIKFDFVTGGQEIKIVILVKL